MSGGDDADQLSDGRLYGSDASDARRREAFAGGDVPVAVYGLGKMGLPLAAVYAETAGNVTGVDVDPAVVETVNAGDCHVTGEPGLADLVAEQVDRGRLEATTDGPAAAAAAAIHVIIVPTLLEDGEPDLTVVESVCEDIAAGLSPGDLVIAESTLPPGTCRDVIAPFLAEASGLEREAFGLAFCPERTSSRTALRDIRGHYPKVVGGIDDESTRAAAAVYDELSSNDVHVVSDATTAEAVKVFEGVYRDVNIALANELSRAGRELGISSREAMATANDLPMCDLHDPGPGVGGHCIPYYPYFLLSRTDESMDLVRTAREINDAMPDVTVSRLADELAAEGVDLADASVLVLGITYRPGVEETRASPAIGVIDELRERGVDAYGTDPLVDPAEYGARPVALEDLPEETFDAAVVVTPHDEFDRIDWDALEPTVVLDGRDALDLEGTAHRVVTLGGERGDAPTVATPAESVAAADGGDGADGREDPDERTAPPSKADGGLERDRPADGGGSTVSDGGDAPDAVDAGEDDV